MSVFVITLGLLYAYCESTESIASHIFISGSLNNTIYYTQSNCGDYVYVADHLYVDMNCSYMAKQDGLATQRCGWLLSCRIINSLN